jgi:hypothetical protein
VRAWLFTTTHFARSLPVIIGQATTNGDCMLIGVTGMARGVVS